MSEVEVNILHNNMYLPLTIDEATYVRGALRSAIKAMRQGDERDFCNRVLDRLNNMILDDRSYRNVSF